jgi:hypothetical protein
MTQAPTNSGQNPALPEIHGYRLLRVLGYGGMSTVYLARQASLEREVALKVMLPEALTDEISRRRFENEARTIARLDHPNIVGIFEVGRTRDGLPYYAMPYLPRGHLGQRGFDQTQVRSILHALLSALEYAHARGVVHRDVKAENVLFDDAERPLLADFGIALRRGYGTRVTTAGLAVGSTAYMPPEQARGHNVDGRADLYSMGVLGWEMLTGRLPYNAGDALSMALQHAQEPIPRLPPELRHWQKFFDRALAKTPEARFSSAREMRAALDRIPERAPVRWFGGGNATPQRRGWFPWVAAAGIVALLLAVAWWRSTPPPRTDVVAVASTADGGLPGPAATDAEAESGAASQGVVAQATDSLDGFMRPLPQSPAERWIAAAQTQIRQERWISPKGDNAYESLMTAVQADAAHPRLPTVATQLIAALARQAAQALQRDDTATAQQAFVRARALAERIPLPPRPGTKQPEAIARMEQQADDILRARMGQANREFDREQASQLVEVARGLKLGEARITALDALAEAVPAVGKPLPREPGWTLLRGQGQHAAIADGYVSRADYARFVAATGRGDTRCRERGSLLRLVAPRSWRSPGFDQSPQQPVVCVSWQDAQAYAQWLGRRDGRRYRLARPAELRAAPVRVAKPVAAWTDGCGTSCSERIADGAGWRGGSDRALQSGRGYDDVSFRLARDL